MSQTYSVLAIVAKRLLAYLVLYAIIGALAYYLRMAGHETYALDILLALVPTTIEACRAARAELQLARLAPKVPIPSPPYEPTDTPTRSAAVKPEKRPPAVTSIEKPRAKAWFPVRTLLKILGIVLAILLVLFFVYLSNW